MPKTSEKAYKCASCFRPISHTGFCLGCNIKRKKLSAKKNAPITERASDFCNLTNPVGMAGKGEQLGIALNQGFVFPYKSQRPSQSEMVSDVRFVLENKKHLIADAPTGLGKTIAALFPAVDYAVNNGKSVFFLTSRLSQHKMALETLRMMKKAGNKFAAVDVVGKMHLCSHDVEGMDNSLFSSFCSAMIRDRKCAFYRNFHSQDLADERKRLFALMKKAGPVDSQHALRLLSSRFCAYEMLMEAAKSSDVIVGDYFHLFGAGEKFLDRMRKSLANSIIIVDEAHNLASRIRNRLSARLSTRTCALAFKEAREFGEQGTAKLLKQVADAVQGLGAKRLFGKDEMFIAKEELTGKIEKILEYDSLLNLLFPLGELVLEEKKISFVQRVASFLDAWQGEDYGYARILSRDKIRNESHIVVQYSCLDPSLVSGPVISESHSAILMSGTLSPAEMHRDLLGMEKERTVMKSYASPFPEENRINIILKSITTLYRKRTPENLEKIASLVAKCCGAIRGNAAVFFPSYELRNRIHALAAPSISKHVIMEDSRMSKEQRDAVKGEMRLHAESGAVLFGVLGGSFSEGIDLPGELLNGVVIIGLPLERPVLSVQALMDYYEQRFRRGRDYGYVYPALIKTMQAAGRCIRSENDRGVIVFADERFLWKNYSSAFPKSWKFTVAENPETEIRNFFGTA